MGTVLGAALIVAIIAGAVGGPLIERPIDHQLAHIPRLRWLPLSVVVFVLAFMMHLPLVEHQSSPPWFSIVTMVGDDCVLVLSFWLLASGWSRKNEARKDQRESGRNRMLVAVGLLGIFVIPIASWGVISMVRLISGDSIIVR